MISKLHSQDLKLIVFGITIDYVFINECTIELLNCRAAANNYFLFSTNLSIIFSISRLICRFIFRLVD